MFGWQHGCCRGIYCHLVDKWFINIFILLLTAFRLISVPPHIIPFDFGTDALNAGDSTSLYCTVNKGDNPVNIEWFLNGRPVLGMDGISVDHYKKKVSNLNIESVRAEHSGKYTCRATNWAGSAYYATVLVVNGSIDF